MHSIHMWHVTLLPVQLSPRDTPKVVGKLVSPVSVTPLIPLIHPGHCVDPKLAFVLLDSQNVG